MHMRNHDFWLVNSQGQLHGRLQGQPQSQRQGLSLELTMELILGIDQSEVVISHVH